MAGTFLEGGVGPNGTFERLSSQCRLQRAVATWRVAGCELFYLFTSMFSSVALLAGATGSATHIGLAEEEVELN